MVRYATNEIEIFIMPFHFGQLREKETSRTKQKNKTENIFLYSGQTLQNGTNSHLWGQHCFFFSQILYVYLTIHLFIFLIRIIFNI